MKHRKWHIPPPPEKEKNVKRIRGIEASFSFLYSYSTKVIKKCYTVWLMAYGKKYNIGNQKEEMILGKNKVYPHWIPVKLTTLYRMLAGRKQKREAKNKILYHNSCIHTN